MINALVIVWRECFEAVLIVGILYSYLKRQPSALKPMRYLWLGVAGGVVLSALLAYAISTAQSELQGQAIEYFQIGMLVVAALLMTQMCIWMKVHARRIKGELETGLSTALSSRRLVGVAGLAALAVAREGFELVMFFYGMSFEASAQGTWPSLLLYSAGGVVLTAFTAWAFYRGIKLFNQKLFFQVTSVFLLVTAGSLILQAVRKLLQMDALPTLADQAWDTSALLDERSPVGQVVATVTGYESTPALITVVIYALFWAVAVSLYTLAGRRAAAPRVAMPAGQTVPADASSPPAEQRARRS